MVGPEREWWKKSRISFNRFLWPDLYTKNLNPTVENQVHRNDQLTSRITEIFQETGYSSINQRREKASTIQIEG